MTPEQLIEQVRAENKRLRSDKEALKKAVADDKMKIAFMESQNASMFEQNQRLSEYIRALEEVSKL